MTRVSARSIAALTRVVVLLESVTSLHGTARRNAAAAVALDRQRRHLAQMFGVPAV